MTDQPDPEDFRINYMESNPNEVAESMYQLASYQLLGRVTGKPWTTVFAGMDRNTQGGILFLWASNLASHIRTVTERKDMVQYREMSVCSAYLEHMRVDHADEPEGVQIVEWALRFLTYAGEFDVDTCQAIMGAAPDDPTEYGLWLGTLMGLWEQVTYALNCYEESHAEAFGTNPVPSSWYENYQRNGGEG